MTRKILGLIISITVLIIWCYLHFLIINRVFKDPNTLKTLKGVIQNKEYIESYKPYFSKTKAFLIKVKGENLKFGISENNIAAFNFIATRDIINKPIIIEYDPNDVSISEITYNVYSMKIGGNSILNYSQSKSSSEYGLVIFLISDLLLIWIIIYVLRKRKKK